MFLGGKLYSFPFTNIFYHLSQLQPGSNSSSVSGDVCVATTTAAFHRCCSAPRDYSHEAGDGVWQKEFLQEAALRAGGTQKMDEGRGEAGKTIARRVGEKDGEMSR